MDKLKPLLEHKFWVMFGLTLLVPLVGWWMASGHIQSEVKAKEDDIKSHESMVPSASATTPNDKFVAAAEKIVADKEQVVREQIQKLWDGQQSRMVWPAGMRSVMSGYDYREKIADQPRIRYRKEYKLERERIVAILDPYVVKPTSTMMMTGANEKGVVAINPAQLPFLDPDAVWGTSTPKSEEMWDAQEDTWLVEAIFRAIANVNAAEGAKIITDAPVFQINTLMLRGGRRGELGATADAASPEGGAYPDGEGDTGTTGLDLFGAGAAGVGGMSDGAASGGIGRAEVAVDPAIVFGDDSLEAADGADGESGNYGAEGGSFLGGGPSSTAGQLPTGRRYIDDDETLPYKTRGFYLHVTMKNEYVPDLMVALTNMEWPTYIVHTRIVEMHPDDVEEMSSDGQFGRSGASSDYGPSSSSSSPRRIGVIPSTIRRGGSTSTDTDGGGTGSMSSGGYLAAALENKRNVEVVICGIMTIYTEPKFEESPGDLTGDGSGDTGTTPTDGEQPTDGEPTDGEPTDGEQPMDGDPADNQPANGESATDDAEAATTDGDPMDGMTVPSPTDDGDADPANPDDGDPAGTNSPAPASNPSGTE